MINDVRQNCEMRLRRCAGREQSISNLGNFMILMSRFLLITAQLLVLSFTGTCVCQYERSVLTPLVWFLWSNWAPVSAAIRRGWFGDLQSLWPECDLFFVPQTLHLRTVHEKTSDASLRKDRWQCLPAMSPRRRPASQDPAYPLNLSHHPHGAGVLWLLKMMYAF